MTRNCFAVVVFATACLFVPVCMGQQPVKPITNVDIVQMVKAGLAESTILLAIKRESVDFDTSPAALMELKKAGVSSAVLNAILQAKPVGYSSTKQSDQSSLPQEASKVIRDPAEYSRYISAVNQQRPAAKAQALEGFIQHYPQSVVNVEALTALMVAYKDSGDRENMRNAADRLLQADHTNLRGLALMAYDYKLSATPGRPTAQQDIQLAHQYAQRGLQALQSSTRPRDFGDADWEKYKAQLSTVFNSSLNAQLSNTQVSVPAVGDQLTLQVVRSWWQGQNVYVNVLVSGRHWTLHCESCSPLDSGIYTAEIGKKDVTVYAHKIGDDLSKRRKQKYKIYSQSNWIEPLR